VAGTRYPLFSQGSPASEAWASDLERGSVIRKKEEERKKERKEEKSEGGRIARVCAIYCTLAIGCTFLSEIECQSLA